MQAKRTVSVILSLLMLFSLSSTFLAGEVSAAGTVISNTSPCILADVGDTVTLADYTVTFSDGTTAQSGVSWTKGGVAATSVSCTQKGVTALVAKSGTKTQNVYVVVKEKTASEYVLFEDDYSKYSSLADLKAAGYTFSHGDSTYSLTDGALTIGSSSIDIARAFLPEWLADLGDYSVSTELKMLETLNNSRWCAVAYRIQNSNGGNYPYYHMCIRENTMASNGIEFAERTPQNQWNVTNTTAADIASMKDAYHTVTVSAFGKAVQYMIDGKELLYVETASLYDKGKIGLTQNYGKLAVKNIKVTVQEGVPTRPEKALDLINIDHAATNLRNAVANVQYVSYAAAQALTGAKTHPSNVIIDLTNETLVEASLTSLIKGLAANKIIPGFCIKTNAQADTLVAAINKAAVNDVFVVSESGDVVKYARSKKVILRGGVILKYDEKTLTSKKADELRETVKKANASFAIIDLANASKQAVAELQQLALAVWVSVGDKAPSVSEVAYALTSGCNGVVSADASVVDGCFTSLFAKNSMTRTPIMIGHRGNPTQAPENSLKGFVTAYNNGADVVEIDIHLSKDKQVIIMHDDTINRTSNGTGSITSLTLEQIKQYKLKNANGTLSEEEIPTLRELLEAFKDTDCRIFVEIKGGQQEAGVEAIKLIEDYKMTDRVDFISFNNTFLNAVRNAHPGVSTGFLLMPTGSTSTMADALDVFYGQLASAQSCSSTVNISSGVLSSLYLTAATDRGMTVWPWTFDAGSNNSPFIISVDGLTTNDVQWAKDMYKSVDAAVSEMLIEAGGSSALNVVATTYGGTETKLAAGSLIVSVIEGDEFVTVKDGVITAVKDGSAKLMVGYSAKTRNGSEYVLYSQPVTVTVGEVTELTFNGGSPYSTSENYILGAVVGNDVQTLLGFIADGGSCIVTDKNDKALGADDKLFTGAKLSFKGSKYTIIVKGDVDGNGKIESVDYSICKRIVLESFSPNEMQSLAADVSGNGKVETSDYAMIKRHVLETYTIK